MRSTFWSSSAPLSQSVAHAKSTAKDQPTEFSWWIVSGCARTVSLMDDGRRQVNEFLWPGDVLGVDDLDVSASDAEAVTVVRLRRYLRLMVETLVQSPAALAVRLRTMAVASLRRVHRQMIRLRCKTATEKVASFLSEVDGRPEKTNRRFVEVPMTRTDIADYLGLTTETVCRVLAHLQNKGTVAILRNALNLRDRIALLELAGELRTGAAFRQIVQAPGRTTG
jgi:CRP/FNR family transcriptional regulator